MTFFKFTFSLQTHYPRSSHSLELLSLSDRFLLYPLILVLSVDCIFLLQIKLHIPIDVFLSRF